MSHEIEQFETEKGKFAAFASLKKPAWHGLGTVAQEPQTTEEMMKLAHLHNWAVRTKPLVAQLGENEDGSPILTEIGGHNVVLRNHPITGEPEPLSVVQSKYAPVQNETVFNFGEAILKQVDGAGWETAGSIKGGRVIFGTIKFPEAITIGQEHHVERYLLVTSSHDGSIPVIAQETPICVVCANTWTMALKQKQTNSWRIRHTKGAEDAIKLATEILEKSTDFDKFVQNAGNKLIAIDWDTAEFTKFLDKLWPKPKEVVETVSVNGGEPEERVANKRAITMWENRREQFLEVWQEKGPRGETLGESRNTAFGGLMTITEVLDWYGMERGGFERAAGFNHKNNTTKQDVFDKLLRKENIKAAELVPA